MKKKLNLILAHERPNIHDETFDALKDHYEREEGSATKEI